MCLKPFFSLLLLCLAPIIYAQENSFVTSSISKPTDLPLHGWNKALKLRNGNTIVLHLVLNEKMRVKVFDSSLNEIASQSEYFKILGEKNLSGSSFEGFYDINGYPILFMTQSIDHHSSLLRMKFDPVNGRLLDEKIVFESKSMIRDYFFSISKSPKSDDYAILCMHQGGIDEARPPRVLYYDKENKLIKTSLLRTDTATARNLYFCGFNYDADHRTSLMFGSVAEAKSPTEKTMKLIYSFALPDDSSFTTKSMLFKDGFYPVRAIVSHNHFSGQLNLSISGILPLNFKILGYPAYKEQNATYFATIDRSTFELMEIKQVKFQAGNEYLNSRANGKSNHNGFTMRSFVNAYGVPRLLSEDYEMPSSYRDKPQRFTSMGNICITKLDDECNEISAVVIPKRQIVMNWLYPFELATRETHKYLFRDIREEAADNQYPSFEYLPTKQNNYLFFNDNASNFGKDLSKPFDTVGYYDHSEALCYQVSRKDEVRSQYLFGKPENDQSRALLLESICEQIDRKEMVALVQVRNGKETHLHLAQCRFE